MDHPDSDLTKQLDGIVTDLRARMPLGQLDEAITGQMFLTIFANLARLSQRIDHQDDYIQQLHDQLDNYQSYYEKVGEVYKATMEQAETLQKLVENRTALDQIDATLDKLAGEAG